jgi:hypothetical protein
MNTGISGADFNRVSSRLSRFFNGILHQDYLVRGECYTAWTSDELAGVYVLLQTRPKTIEIVFYRDVYDFNRFRPCLQ